MVKNLRLLREEAGLSQQKLADMLSISQQAIFKYEKTSNEPDIATLIRLSEIFNVSVDFLIGNSVIRERDTKQNAVMLTDTETAHIKLWRKLPKSTQTILNELISEFGSKARP